MVPNVVTFSMLLTPHVAAGDSAKAEAVFARMVAAGVVPDLVTFSMLLTWQQSVATGCAITAQNNHTVASPFR